MNYTINYCREYADKLDIICCSQDYVNTKVKMNWKCKTCDYEWEASFSSILSYKKSGCPRCKKVRINDNDLHEMAHFYGGEYLGTHYKNSLEKIPWKCANGHFFYATWESVRSGHWCTECSSGMGERITRGIMKRIFNADFEKTRNIKTDIATKPLELDGFSEDLMIAFEYQGLQHEKYVSYFHQSLEEYETRKKYDKEKIEKCKEKNIKLVIIPDFIHYDNLDRMIDIVETSIKQAGIEIPQYEKPITIGEILISDYHELSELCIKQEGKLITDAFLGWDQKHEYECKEGHRWKATAYSIKSGSWCRKCQMKAMGLRTRKYTIEDARKLAKEKNGECLSTLTSITNNEDLKWYCNIHNKTWEAPISRIIQGGWCPICGREKSDKNRRAYTIEDLISIAKERGGNCLSKEYTRADVKYRWICKKSHEWEATFNDIKGSKKHAPTWCPYCARKAKKSIEDMQKLAAEHNGECLSTEYRGAFVHLQWKCAYGHIFSAQPTNVQQGKWCKDCKGKRIWETRRMNKR